MDNYSTNYSWQDAQEELLFQPHYDFEGTLWPVVDFPQCGMTNLFTPPSGPLTIPYNRTESVSSSSTASQRSPVIEAEAAFASDSLQLKWSGNDKRQVRQHDFQRPSDHSKFLKADLEFQRRREQNRFAQRAYRERREQYQIELEKQLAEMRKKYEILCRSHSEQENHILQLRALIEDLSARKSAAEKDSSYPMSISGQSQEPVSFDMYSCAFSNGQSIG